MCGCRYDKESVICGCRYVQHHCLICVKDIKCPLSLTLRKLTLELLISNVKLPEGLLASLAYAEAVNTTSNFQVRCHIFKVCFVVGQMYFSFSLFFMQMLKVW